MIIRAYGSLSSVGDFGEKITRLGGIVFNAVQMTGVGIALICITILGAKYMTASVDGKADIKKKLVPFLIGTVIFFGSTIIVRLIVELAAAGFGGTNG